VKTALVTGASSGIGYELANILANDGYSLILVARSGDRLLKIAEDFRSRYGATAHVMAKDLAQPGAGREVFEELKGLNILPEILVNNAGFGGYGPFSQTRLADELDMIALNIAALTELTKLFLPGMLAENRGRILNVASTAAFQPGPLMAVYYATKAYVLLFSEALAEELKGTGVTVTALCPGPTRSEFQKRSGIEKINLLEFDVMMSAAKVARTGYRALLRGQRIAVPGLLNKLFIFLIRFLPRRCVTRVVYYLQKKGSIT